MRYFLGFLTTPIYYFFFGMFLAIFHPIQWICLHWLGYSAHKKSVDCLNFCLSYSLILVGCRIKVKFHEKPSINHSYIFVSNHQSLFDIPPLIWHLRNYHAKFIAKDTLRNIPSISFNLKHGGGANINRKNTTQAIEEIQKLGQRMQKNKWSAVIFPEGTRSRNGQIKDFKVGGIATLIKQCPEVKIVPVAIQNSWKLMRFGGFPLSFGETVYVEIMPVLLSNEQDNIEKVVLEAENIVKIELLNLSNKS